MGWAVRAAFPISGGEWRGVSGYTTELSAMVSIGTALRPVGPPTANLRVTDTIQRPDLAGRSILCTAINHSSRRSSELGYGGDILPLGVMVEWRNGSYPT
jgi:hypothetical protein